MVKRKGSKYPWMMRGAHFSYLNLHKFSMKVLAKQALTPIIFDTLDKTIRYSHQCNVATPGDERALSGNSVRPTRDNN